MKTRLILLFVLVLGTGSIGLFAQHVIADDPKWEGTFKFEPIALVNGPFGNSATDGSNSLTGWEGVYFPQIVVDVVPLISKFVGIPVVFDVGLDPADSRLLALGLMSGVEVTPIERFAPAGLFFRVEAGFFWVSKSDYNYASFMARADIGWQIITRSGFLITPGFGLKYNPVAGNSLDLMVDIGTAF